MMMMMMMMMMVLQPFVMMCCNASVMKYELKEYDSVAHDNATVVRGNARFTILTSRTIRMEYDSDGKFEDRPSLAVVNRKMSSVPSFKVSDSGDTVTITTSHLTLTYDSSKKAFDSDNLQVTGIAKTSSFKSWNPSMNSANDDQNLRGTYRTLDGTKNVSLNCNNNGKMGDHCAFGLVYVFFLKPTFDHIIIMMINLISQYIHKQHTHK